MNRIIYLSVLLIFCASTFGQSDYQKIQNFKEKMQSFKTEIESADSLGQLESIMTRLEAYKRKTEPDRVLLNKALYPEDYDKSFENLNKNLRYAIEKTAAITDLQEEVDTSKNIISRLRREIIHISESELKLRVENDALLSEIQKLKGSPEGDKASLDSLKLLTARLKDVILKRDIFISAVIDSIFTSSFQRYEQMSSGDQANVIATIKSSNLLERVKDLIADNISIIERNLFVPEDLGEYKVEQKKFEANWKKFGTTLVDIYSEQNESRNELYEVEFMLSEWDKKIDEKIWFEIHDIFDNHNIKISEFHSGSEFEDAIIKYIKGEIDSSQGSDDVERVKTFSFFYDDVWEKKINNEWMPVLIKNDLLAETQKENIENEIDRWAGDIDGINVIWIYILCVIVLIIIINIWNSKRQKAKKEENSFHKQKS